MNIHKNLVIAFAGALLLFSTGCTKKASRPTPELTAMGGGTSSVSTVDTSSSSSSFTSSPSQLLSDSQAGNQAYGTNMAFVTNAPVETLTEKPPLSGTAVGDTLRDVPELPSIFFAFDRSAIEQKERAKFQAIKDYLAKNPQFRILFEGHCDWRGTADYNLALGDRRANAAKKYAVSIGIDPAKIDIKSMGSQKATERASESVMANDRRAEIVVLMK